MGGNQWDALRASHLLASSKPLSSILVPREGVEPSSLLEALTPEASVFANFTIAALFKTPELYPAR